VGFESSQWQSMIRRCRLLGQALRAEHFAKSIRPGRPFWCSRKINAHFLTRHMGRPALRGKHPGLDAALADDPRQCSFLLQNYYVQQWADNFVIHLFVSDLRGWWEHIVALDLAARYGVKTRAPQLESWGVQVAGIVDPSGVLWRIHEDATPN
jgi:hypothetical protein